MGVVATIDHESFPEQSNHIGKRTKVCFKYDTSHEIGGVIVRDDIEEPHRVIIRLDDGRHVLATECMYSILR